MDLRFVTTPLIPLEKVSFYSWCYFLSQSFSTSDIGAYPRRHNATIDIIPGENQPTLFVLDSNFHLFEV